LCSETTDKMQPCVDGQPGLRWAGGARWHLPGWSWASTGWHFTAGAPRAAGGASSVGRAWRPGAAVPVGPGAAPAGGPEAAAPGLPAASATAGEVGADSRAAGTAFGLPLCSKTKDITQPCIEAQPGVGWAGSASWLNSGSWPGSGGVGWGGINPAWSWLWPHPHSAGCSCPKVVLHPAARHTPSPHICVPGHPYWCACPSPGPGLRGDGLKICLKNGLHYTGCRCLSPSETGATGGGGGGGGGRTMRAPSVGEEKSPIVKTGFFPSE